MKYNVLDLTMARSRGNIHRIDDNKKMYRLKCRWIGHHIFKLLVRSKSTREFRLIHSPIKAQGNVRYEFGKYFIRNNASKMVDCLCIQNNTKRLRKLWSISAIPRWEDQAVIKDSASMHNHQEHIDKGYGKPYLLVLRANSRLERYDLNTGAPLESLRLFNDTKFNEISQDPERGWLILKSVIHTRPTDSAPSDLLLRFLICKIAPMKMLYHIPIRRSDLEVGTQTVCISNGLLIVQGRRGSIKLYSLDVILDSATESNSRDNIAPNIKILGLGPCLFAINAFQHSLQINESPWIYIKKDSDFECSVKRIVDHKLLGRVNLRSTIDPERVTFLSDDTGRIVAYGKAMQIFKADTEEFRLYEVSNLTEKALFGSECRVQEFSRSGRKLKKIKIEQEEAEEFYRLDYEDELDILGIVSTKEIYQEDDDAVSSIVTFVKEVRLLEGKALGEIRRIPVEQMIQRPGTEVVGETSLMLDLDFVSIKVRSGARSTIYVYQLCEITDKVR